MLPANGPDDPDVLVIGGGIVGLFCAYHLRRAGASVTVVERATVGDPLACSYGNTGFVGTQGAAPLAEPGASSPDTSAGGGGEVLRWLWHFRRACNERDASAAFAVLLDMKKRSLDILHDVCASGRIAATFTARGMLLAYKTAEGFDKARRSMPHLAERGVPLRILDPAELRALEPDVEFDIAGALYNEAGGALRVPDFIVEFARTLEGMGVGVRAHAEVLGFEATNHKITRVRTAAGDFAPGETVIAAGTWSAECARMLDIRLQLQPVKGYSVTIATPPNAPRLPVLMSEGRVALAPLGDRLRFAGSLELAGTDASVSRRHLDGILRTVAAHLPRLEITEPREIWSGFRPCTPDGLPYIGRTAEYRNLSIACGHGPIGMGLAPAGGKLIAQIITGARPDMDLTPFRVGRYGGSGSPWSR